MSVRPLMYDGFKQYSSKEDDEAVLTLVQRGSGGKSGAVQMLSDKQRAEELYMLLLLVDPVWKKIGLDVRLPNCTTRA